MILIRFLADAVTRHRFLTALAMALATALAIWGHLYVPPPPSEADPDAPANSGSRLRVATSDGEGIASDCFLVVETDDLFNPASVAALRHVVGKVESQPYIDSVMWIDTIPVLNVFGLREPLLPPNDASAERFEAARERLMHHPLVIGQLLSDDGRTLLMPIKFDWLRVKSDEDCSEALLQAARDAAASSPDTPLKIRLTGRVPLYIAYQDAFDKNHRKFQIISYSLVLGLALLLFRGIRAVMVVAAAPALGIIWTLGLLNWMDELSNPLTSVVVPVLLTMVGLTDGVHLMVHIRRARADGMTPQEATRSAVLRVGLACALTSLTTAIGFASLLVAQSEFVRGFGRGCAIGVVVTFFAVVTTIPVACSSWLGNNIHKGHERDLVGHGLQRFGWLIEMVLRRSKLVSAIAVISTLIFAIGAAQLRPDDRMQDSQPTGSEAYQALAHCDKALGGIEFVRVRVEWSESAFPKPEEILTAIESCERILSDEPSLRHPLSILNILASFPGDESVTNRLAFLELLPTGTRAAYLDTESRVAEITVRIQDLGIAHYEPVFQRVEQRLTELQSRYPGFTMALVGDPVRRGRNLYRIVTDLASSLGTAAITIFFVMTLAYRSLRIGLITLVPNLFPLVVTACMMVLFGHPLEIASVCAFTVCLGIAVDDTIHFLTQYRSEVDRHGDVELAIRDAFHGVGSAMIITTFILITGFGTVLTSDLPGQRYFAAMAVSTIAGALVGDLIFLPALLATFSRERRAGAVDT
ncbi:MAG: MMPL family transporter [Planctomycetaceae bacterium]|nr:MMPL family transporter [Planctomycetales bacterium]MCB9926619.1 MMPL family transporter [Planctomycetaceae bacterium]